MKKLYLLVLLCTLSMTAFCQSTVAIFAKYPVGSFKTGTSNVSPSRTDDTLRAQASVNRGYAVFDISSIPPSATITAVSLHFYIRRVQGGGPGTGTIVRSYNGDISTISSPATLYATITGAPNVWTNTWPTTNNTKARLGSVAAAVALVQSNLAGGKVSLMWGTSNGRQYTILGESASLDTNIGHAPFISVTYTCPGMTTVNATPTPNRVCIGSAVGLTSTAPGAASWSWVGPGGFSAATQTTSAITTISGVNVYTVTASNAGGCGLKAVTNVTVNALPTPTVIATGPSAFCPGGNVTLNAVPGGLTYQWLEDGSALTGETNATYTAVTGAVYSVRGTDAQGCVGTSTGAPVFEITVPALTPSGAVVLCSGGSVPMSVNTGGVTAAGGITFQWQKDGAAIPGATNSTYAATTSGVFDVVVSAGPGCSGTSDAANVTINGLPNPTVNYNGSQVYTTNTFSSYQWYLNMTAISGATSYTHTPTMNGNYRVQVTASNGCANYSPSLAVGNLGVHELNADDVRVYPNPATSAIRIEAPVTVSVLISSMDGRVVAEQNNTNEMNIANLSGGMYLISVFDENGHRIVTQKLIKQ